MSDAETGEYIEDDPIAWEAVVRAINRYGKRYDSMHQQFGEDAAGILAGAFLSYLASEHGVYVRRSALEASVVPEPTDGHCQGCGGWVSYSTHDEGYECPGIRATRPR